MKYASFPLREAENIVLAHSIRFEGQRGRLHKGHRLAPDDIERLREEGIASVIGVRLDAGDVLEDKAAGMLAAAIAPDHLTFSEPATGRVNVYAATAGLFVANTHVVNALNGVDPSITLACLKDRVSVKAGDMVATFKIIPLAVDGDCLGKAVALLGASTPFEVKPFEAHAVTLIATELPTLKTSVMDRTAKLIEQRLALSGSTLVREIRIPHTHDALTAALQALDLGNCREPSLVIVFGASAVADEEDVIPAAIRAAGGEVIRVGMPVDPGNLLVYGDIGGVTVLGAPGCARSPKENGFDWMLHRLLAGERPTSDDIAALGVGGLLMEIPTRPAPRDRSESKDDVSLSVAAVLLAAGQARRMGESGLHKLLAEFDGVPLVRRSAEMLLASKATPVVVVTGHRQQDIAAELSSLDVRLQDNPSHEAGMASSLIAGFTRPDVAAADGVLVMLADMPGVTVSHIDALLGAFGDAGGEAIVRAVSNGKRGNPVILPRATYDAVRNLQGDVGARAIIETSGLPVIDVDIGPAAHLDVDTPEAVIAAGGVLMT
ncbi:molybdopterin-binding/glycosyltransferase family 2 protein [Rhizobium sp. NFR12]|uniref:NTP transferase domain-containing protein n=1 Tax=Rhizobium sp. NFR12 TaxID=1566261 RepID=UPI0008A7DF29|nr:molybdopterin-binding/glycosyltransferase family 2 protein [Rhizobium sp. NFR12]SEH23024.1 molybdenum cofactor cytidylyltransferase [Rhizobium sp. NFR12]